MTRPRLRREPPDRTEPIRNPFVAASRGEVGVESLAPIVTAAIDQGLAAARLVAKTADTTVRGAVEQGVNTAYLVIDEYMRRGREAAGRHHERTNGSQPMSGAPRGESEQGSGQNQLPPFMAPWMTVFRMWSDAMAAFVPGGQGLAKAWMDQMMAASSTWMGADASSRARISFEVTSRSPTEVSALLDPSAYYAKLSVDELMPREPSKGKPVAGVRIESSGGHVCIGISVPDDQAPGTYCGIVRDDMGAKRGEVTAEVKPSPSAKPRKK